MADCSPTTMDGTPLEAAAICSPCERFAGHVAYYAPCIAEFEDSRATGAPLLMLYCGKDAIVDPDRCAEMAAALEAGGSQVDAIVYPDALHQWDGRFGSPRMIRPRCSSVTSACWA